MLFVQDTSDLDFTAHRQTKGLGWIGNTGGRGFLLHSCLAVRPTAVPENTPIKAAEDGVVAYAGNELKGYGNLVLVRHPNGYVTAYAHAKELVVKRGDQVKRGQIIARAGQTGSVSSPQLHFEIRKGATPVDPVQYLPGT